MRRADPGLHALCARLPLVSRPRPDRSVDDDAALVALAQAHGFQAPLYAGLTQRPWRNPSRSAMAPASLALLETAYAASVLRAARFEIELRRCQAQFLAAGIRSVSIKGGDLAWSAYPDPAWRPMADLDFFVRPGDVETAGRLLIEDGYAVAHGGFSPGLNPVFGHHDAYQRRDGPVPITVELHSDLLGGRGSRRAPDLDWFWSQAVRGEEGRLAWAAEASLLYVAAHWIYEHGNAPHDLRWAYDVHLLVLGRLGCLDWALVKEKAQSFLWAAGVAEALARVQDLFSSPVPAGMSADLWSAAAPADRNWVRRRVGPLNPRQKFFLNLAALRPGAQAACWRGMLWPSPAFIQARYARWGRWWWLGYAARWLRLAGQAGRKFS